jgi:hypothetical protein
MAPGLRRSRLPALAAGGTRAGAPARRARPGACRGRPPDQPVRRAGPGRDRRADRASAPGRRARPAGRAGRAQRRARTAGSAGGRAARRRGTAGRRRDHRCLRRRGPRPGRSGMRHLRQHQRQRHPGHGGRSAHPVRARCAGLVDQAPQAARPDSRDPVLVRGGGLLRGGVRHQPRRLHVGGRAPACGRARRAGAGPATVHLPGRNGVRPASRSPRQAPGAERHPKPVPGAIGEHLARNRVILPAWPAWTERSPW